MQASWNDIRRSIWLLIISPIYCFPLDPAVSKSNEILTSESSIDSPRTLNEHCSLDAQCQGFDANSECDTICRCKKNYGIVVTKTSTVCRHLHADLPPPTVLGGRCKTSEECINHLGKKSECFKKEFSDASYGKCICVDGAEFLDGKCTSSVDPESARQEEFFQAQPSDYKFAIIIVISTVVIFVILFLGIGFLKFFLPCLHPTLHNQCVQVHLDPSRPSSTNQVRVLEDSPPSYIELMKREINIQSPPPEYSEVVRPQHSSQQKSSSVIQTHCHHCCHSQNPPVRQPMDGQDNNALAKD